MNVQLNFTNYLNLAIDQTFHSTDLKNFCGHVFINMKKIAETLINNKGAQTMTIIAANLLLVNLANKIIEATFSKFNNANDNSDNRWYEAGKIGVESIVVLTSVNLLNNLMKLNLTRFYIVAIAATTISLQVLLQEAFTQAMANEKEDNTNLSPETDSADLSIDSFEKEMDEKEIEEIVKEEKVENKDTENKEDSSENNRKKLSDFSDPIYLDALDSTSEKLLESSKFLLERTNLLKDLSLSPSEKR